MQLLAQKYARPVPRYTSYPTAAEFHDMDEATVVRAIGVNQWSRRGAYVHVPYCSAGCWYCGCNKIVTRNDDIVSRYVDVLLHEIELQARYWGRGESLCQLQFGGGTPTRLSQAQFTEVLKKLDQAFGLRCDERDYSFETDPRFCDPQMIGYLANAGFNRVSLGVQDFDEKVQSMIGRHQSVAQTQAIVDAARNHSMRSVNFDLVYGLPGQTLQSLQATLEQVGRMRPDRIALFGYAHLPSRFPGQRQFTDLPSPETRMAMARLADDFLTDHGYQTIGLDHYAQADDPLVNRLQKGDVRRNFQGYSEWSDVALIGLGATAIGQTSHAYFQNVSSTREYRERIGAGQLAVQHGILLDSDDFLRGTIIQSLFAHHRVNGCELGLPDTLAQTYPEAYDQLQEMFNDGIIEMDSDLIVVKPQHRALTRHVAAAFDRHRATGTGSFSAGV